MIPCLAALVVILPGFSVLASDRHDDEGEEEEFTREHHGPRICSNTAHATFNACGHDIKDNFWIAYGKCINNESKRDTRGCIREAKADLREARSLCRQQKRARLNICEAVGEEAYAPDIDPSQFLSPEAAAAAPNPYFPLVPGLVRILKSGDETITVTVTNETKEILGVTCIVVRDVVEENGEIIEDTDDWYTQDMFGNVWYFGEISKNYEDGDLANLDGSWKGGVDDAQPGIIMKAKPEVGDIYRQEFALGEAEDMAEVISTTETAETVPAATCINTCVVTRDFLPIEPGHVEKKFFAPGIGNILSINLDTGKREELIQVIQP
ncbi:MAG: hypothetical protein OEZ41_04575 [Nitrospirota bacterium]|nr:hypothetical protein [Nitrospirota bacterium]MDH5699220.1 hypothetical protein [Nitrospirota bacterium]